jgi:hypothetical protein
MVAIAYHTDRLKVMIRNWQEIEKWNDVYIPCNIPKQHSQTSWFPTSLRCGSLDGTLCKAVGGGLSIY